MKVVDRYGVRMAVIAAAIAAGGCAGTRARPPSPTTPPPARDTPALPVMTFNIRYGTAPDGDDAWPKRRDQALRVIDTFNPALLGLQEALRAQLDEIEAALPDYGEAGVGRDDGRHAGEHAAILYDRRRLDLLDQGTFWLSDTPEVPGSMTWGNRFPRVVSWGRFQQRASLDTFYLFNTHWDHESQTARERGAQLMAERIAGRKARRDPVLVTGDFNCGDDNPALRTLLGWPPETPPEHILVDTFRTFVHSPLPPHTGTFHAFHGGRDGVKIDFVLASPEWYVANAAIVLTSENGHYPSDHFPVTATVVRQKTEVYLGGKR